MPIDKEQMSILNDIMNEVQQRYKYEGSFIIFVFFFSDKTCEIVIIYSRVYVTYISLWHKVISIDNAAVDKGIYLIVNFHF